MKADTLSEERAKGELEKPPATSKPRSMLEFWERFLPATVIVVGACILLEFILGLFTSLSSGRMVGDLQALQLLFCLIAIVLVVYLWRRARWIRLNRYISADPDSGNIKIQQSGRWWWGLADDDPDEVDITQLEYFGTPKRRYFQRRDLPWPISLLTFDCGDIEMPGKRPPLRNVDNIPELVEIRRYRKELKSQSLRNERSQIDLQDAILREQERQTGLLERNNQLLETLIGQNYQILTIFQVARDDAAYRASHVDENLHTDPIGPVGEIVEEDSP